MLRLLRRSSTLVLILVLFGSNVLLLTSTAFNAAISGALMTTLGVRTVSGALSASLSASEKRLATAQLARTQRSTAVRQFGRSLSARTRRVAARGIAAVPAESIPYVGAAVVVASVSYELYEACQTLRELDQLYENLGLSPEVSNDALGSVCSPPTFDLPAS